MAFADASETQLALVAESTFGTTPTSPSFQKYRYTGEDLTEAIQNLSSDEITTTADISDLIQVGENAEGGFSFELSHGTSFDTLFEHALRGTFASNTLTAGTEKKSFTAEKLFETGATDHYFRFTGLRVANLSMRFPAAERVSGTVDFLGLGGTTSTAALSGSTYAATNTNRIMAAKDVASLTIGGVSGSITLTEISFALANNLRAQPAVGQVQAAGIGYGRREITGTLNAYFENIDLYEEFAAGNASSLTYDVTDGTNTYNFNFHNIKYETGRVLARGNNTDVLAEMTWRGLFSSGDSTSLTVTR